MNALKRGKHENPRMQNVFNKYPEGWQFIVVELVTRDQLIVTEQKHLDTHYGNTLCMNLTPTAKMPPSQKGKKRKPRSPEYIEKIRAAAKLRRWSKEQRVMLSNAHKGIPAWNKGLKYTDEQKSKLAIMQWARKPGQPAWNKGITWRKHSKPVLVRE